MPGKGDRDDLDLEPEQVRKIFIGGLDYGTTEETLEAYFERWGDIVDLVVMKDPYTKRSRGFGFVTYSHSEMVDEAMTHRPHKIDGREVETKRAIPKDEIESIPQQALDVKKLFVGGLKHLEEPDLQEHFSQFGNVVACDLILNRDTGMKRGFAFVEYDDTDAVDKVILHKKHEVKGVRLFVKKAVEWTEVRKSKDGYRPRGGFRGGRGGGRDGDDYYERRGSYRDDYDGGRRGGGRGRGRGFSRRGSYSRDDGYDNYRGGGGGSGRRGGYRDDDDWDDRPPRRDFSRNRDDDWEVERPSRRFRDDSEERGGYGGGGGGGRWDSDGPKKSSWGGGGSGGGGGGGGGGGDWRRGSPDRADSGFGGGSRFGGGPVRSSFNSGSRSTPYETSYPLNRRGRY